MILCENVDSIRVTPDVEQAIVFSVLPGLIRGVTGALSRIAFFIWGGRIVIL
jgi:hypothetical protein